MLLASFVCKRVKDIRSVQNSSFYNRINRRAKIILRHISEWTNESSSTVDVVIFGKGKKVLGKAGRIVYNKVSYSLGKSGEIENLHMGYIYLFPDDGQGADCI